MSPSWLLALVSPLLVGLVVLGTVAVVALFRASSRDVPKVLAVFAEAMASLAARMPTTPSVGPDADAPLEDRQDGGVVQGRQL
jgi:hypothetical protein